MTWSACSLPRRDDHERHPGANPNALERGRDLPGVLDAPDDSRPGPAMSIEERHANGLRERTR